MLHRQLAAFLGLALCAAAQAEQQPARTWEFDLNTPGTYKVQVEHELNGIAPGGTKVIYSIQIGKETQTRELGLIANRPFLPLITDIPTPQKMRVTISGLSQPALQHTSVYAYESNSLPPGEYFDPAKDISFKEARYIRDILKKPASEIDLARTKVSIDKLIDPGINVEGTLQNLDAMVARIKTMREFGVSSTAKLQALKRYLYEPGDWNGYRAYQYDLEDPLGTKISNKLLSNYLASRKGNCVTMPLLFVILGQRIGLDVTASTAPKHILVKFKDDTMGWINLEATSGANPAREVWIREQMPMTDEAIKNGVYLQPLTKKETAAVMANVLAEYYVQQKEYEKAIAIGDLTLEYYPKDVGTMTMKAVAFGRSARQQFMEKYPSPAQIPVSERGRFEYLSQNNRLWFAKAEALGWREETKEEEKKYLRNIDQTRQQNTVR